MDNSGAEWVRKLGLLSLLAVWSVLAACTAEPTRTALTASPEASRTTPASSTASVKTSTTTAPTPGATPALGANAEQDLVTLRAAARDAQGGFLFYLDAPGRTGNPQVFDVPGGQPFEAIIVAGNYGVKEHDFALLCIVDYAQKPCGRDASETKYQFHLAPGVETRLKVSVPLEPGTHDMLFITFYDPTNHSSEQNFRQESRFMFSFYRTQIVAGEGDKRLTADVAQRFSTKSDLEPGSGFFTIRRDAYTGPSQAPWHAQESAKNTSLEFIAAYSNPDPGKRTVALMAFVDFDQVPWDGSHSTYFAELDAGARADVPAQLAGFQTEGEHELVVVSVDNPFLDLAGEVGSEEPRSFFADSSDRVLVTVR